MPTVRNSAIQSSSASSFTVNWPSGTAIGDTVVIFYGGGFQISAAPTGWTLILQLTGANTNGSTLYKTMTSGDITAGSVTIAAAGTFNSVIAVVTMTGTCSIKPVGAAQSGSGSTSVAVSSTSGSPQPSDLLLYFGANRATSTNTVNFGSLLGSCTISATNASGAVFSDTGYGGFISPRTFFFSTAGSGNYESMVCVSPADDVFTMPAYAAPAPSSVVVFPVGAHLAGGISGVAYTENITAQGGTSPYTFTLTGGSLPTSTTMSSSGVISGTPTATGTFNFTVTVTDALGYVGSQGFQIIITASVTGGGSYTFLA